MAKGAGAFSCWPLAYTLMLSDHMQLWPSVFGFSWFLAAQLSQLTTSFLTLKWLEVGCPASSMLPCDEGAGSWRNLPCGRKLFSVEEHLSIASSKLAFFLTAPFVSLEIDLPLGYLVSRPFFGSSALLPKSHSLFHFGLCPALENHAAHRSPYLILTYSPLPEQPNPAVRPLKHKRNSPCAFLKSAPPLFTLK